jgi:hypothetical protein
MRNKKKNAARMIVLSSVAVVISLFTAAICLYAAADTNPYVGMDKMNVGPTYQLEDLNAVEGVAMASADAVELYKGMGMKDSIDLKGLENSILKQATTDVDSLNNAQVPEPATLTLLTLGGLAILRKSRKNKKN